jgi:hypothetical protein
MPLDEEQLAKLSELLVDAASCSRLSQWEKDFVADFMTRLETYGPRVTVSPRQWDVFERLTGKVYAT